MGDRTGTGATFDDGSVTDVLARITDAVFALDEQWRFTYLNRQAERVFEREREDLLGTVLWETFPEPIDSTFEEQYRRAMETQEAALFEAFSPPLDVWFEVRAYPSETGLSVYLRDITERVRQNEELRQRERALNRAYEIVADSTRTFTEKIDALLGVVREAVGTEYATLSRIEDDLYVFEAVDAPDDADLPGETVPLEITNCERVLSTERTLVLDDIERDAPELAGRAGNAEWGISCYLGAPVFVDGEVYGTFCFYDTDARTNEFSEWQVTFVDLLSNWVSYELERQRHLAQLAVLDELNGVVRAITDAVIDQSTREEIEAIACRSLADTDSYLFAWVGGVDQSREHVTLRTEAGVEGFLDGVEIASGGEGTARTPTGRAIQTGTVQVARDGQRGDDDVWRDHADAYGYHAWAAVPITDEGTLYGVLNVYAARPDAFAEQERAVVEQLGGLLGHAITATQRRDALMSDDLVELDFEIRDAFEAAGVVREDAGTISFDRTVPVEGGNYLVYGWTDERGVETLQTVVESVPFWKSLDVLSEHDGEVRFSVRLSEPPVVSVVASQGGRVKSARIEDGDYRMRVHLPHSADVHLLVDTVRQSYPNAEVIAQRQTPLREDANPGRHVTLLADLTERQRAAIEAAFYAGFFEWPRDSNGEDVATSLGISPATFHQHLRTGERKILHSLLTDEE